MAAAPVSLPWWQGLHMFYITLLVLATVTHAFANLVGLPPISQPGHWSPPKLLTRFP